MLINASDVLLMIRAMRDGGAENAGVENAGVEKAETITYGKPSEQKTLTTP